MSFVTPDYQAIRDAILRDIANQVPAASVGPDSDFTVRANATGAAVEGLYQHQQWIVRQLFPDTSDSDYLERHAGLRGITRKAATVATGAITFSGTPGASVALGTSATAPDGTIYVTTVAGTVGVGGTVVIAAQASV
ncbi:MAG: phage tail protein, partial [Rhodocyclaceae bacterium]